MATFTSDAVLASNRHYKAIISTAAANTGCRPRQQLQLEFYHRLASGPSADQPVNGRRFMVLTVGSIANVSTLHRHGDLMRYSRASRAQ